tara:strand:+ start:9824 stop:10744 length:921 start_codon:yes stop_codon:yes gene_type:complete
MNCYCTIITANYFFYAKALFDSLAQFQPNASFKVLVVDAKNKELAYNGIDVVSLIEIKESFPDDYTKIAHYESDPESNLRWALKPIFLKYLLLSEKFDKVLFLDPDLFFYNDPSFLFEKLVSSDVILTPHWRSKDPEFDQANFESLFTGGLFNAGFFGCNKNAINILDWWLKVCAYKMVKEGGFYVDQAYLNLMPIYFTEQVEVIQHKGCNISNWNMIECQRSLVKDDVIIDKKFPLIFIHFTNATINFIAFGKDAILKPHLRIYKETLLNHNASFKFNYEIKTISQEKKKPNLLSKLIHKRKKNE